MSNFVEQPFDEREARYFLAEILKDSRIAPVDLITIIKQGDIQPRWTEIALPHGRSVSTCQKAFEHLLSHPSAGFPISFRSPSNPEPKAIPSKAKKRSYPGGDAMTVDRIIQPRVSDFSSVNAPYSPQYLPATASMSEPQRKKRGRPSKAEHEIRVAEYAARGETYPAPRKSKTPRQSGEGLAPTALMMTPKTKEAEDTGPALISTTTQAGIEAVKLPTKKRVQPSAAEMPSDNTTLEISSQSAGPSQLQSENALDDSSEKAPESILPKARSPSESGSHRLLIAQMQEHIARNPPEAIGENLNPQRKTAQEQGVKDERSWETYQPSSTTS